MDIFAVGFEEIVDLNASNIMAARLVHSASLAAGPHSVWVGRAARNDQSSRHVPNCYQSVWVHQILNPHVLVTFYDKINPRPTGLFI